MKKEEKRKKKRFSSHGGEAGKRRVKCEERNVSFFLLKFEKNESFNFIFFLFSLICFLMFLNAVS